MQQKYDAAQVLVGLFEITLPNTIPTSEDGQVGTHARRDRQL
jgi:hypothetical protein